MFREFELNRQQISAMMNKEQFFESRIANNLAHHFSAS
jgi:hypothetical protein